MDEDIKAELEDIVFENSEHMTSGELEFCEAIADKVDYGVPLTDAEYRKAEDIVERYKV